MFPCFGEFEGCEREAADPIVIGGYTFCPVCAAIQHANLT